MTRQGFLAELTASLQGQVPQGVLREQVNFYASYIDTQISCGKTEEAVLEELGDPRLIARTIIDSTGAAGQNTSCSGGTYYSSESSVGRDLAGRQQNHQTEKNGNSAMMNIILILVLVLLVLICVLGTIFRFLFSPFGLFFILCACVYFWFLAKRR